MSTEGRRSRVGVGGGLGLTIFLNLSMMLNTSRCVRSKDTQETLTVFLHNIARYCGTPKLLASVRHTDNANGFLSPSMPT